MIFQIRTRQKEKYGEYVKVISTLWVLFIPLFSWESIWKYK